jgi:hypothetical protein
VDAAADGDVLLVRAGTDPSLLIQGKSLSIVVEPLANALIQGVLTIEQLSSAQCVVITGLKVFPTLPGPAAVSIQNCLGHVRLNQCTIQGSPGDWQVPHFRSAARGCRSADRSTLPPHTARSKVAGEPDAIVSTASRRPAAPRS